MYKNSYIHQDNFNKNIPFDYRKYEDKTVKKSGAKIPLDTNKKSVRTPSQKDTKITHAFRSQLYEMRRVSGGFKITDKDYERGYTSVSCCGRVPVNDNGDTTPINVVTGKETGNIYYNGLMKCGSVWRCPVCNYKITQQRKKEIYYLTSEFMRKSEFNRISFITLTMRHKSTYPLKYTLDTLLEEFRKFQRTSVYKRLEREHNIKGFIKSLEITVSKRNGWHPHLHLLVFHQSDNIELLHREIKQKWAKRKKINALQKNQICKEVYNKAGVTDYVTKWTISDELTKGSFKLPKLNKNEKGITPFQILSQLTLGKNSIKEETELKGYLGQYFQYTHGKHLIHISKKLLKDLKNSNIDTTIKSDKEILEDETPEKILFKIDKPVWYEVAKYNYMAQILNNYESKGVDFVLDKLKSNFPTLELKYNKQLKLIYSPIKNKENEKIRKLENRNKDIINAIIHDIGNSYYDITRTLEIRQ